jgi:hypothetical protein
MKREINMYKDGATVRLHNKRISFKETDKKTMIDHKRVYRVLHLQRIGNINAIKGKLEIHSFK